MFNSLGDENAAYVLKCRCLPDPVTKAATIVDHVRLFRNHPQIRWKYRIHEQILPAVRRVGGEPRWADVVINHTGYLDHDLRRRKQQRDLRILTLEHQEQPDDPFTLFNLGSIYQDLNRHQEALAAFEKSLRHSAPTDSIVRKLYVSIAQCHKRLGQSQQALQTYAQGRKHYPQDVELLYREGLLRKELNDIAGAEQCWLQVFTSREDGHFTSVIDGIQGYRTHHSLAALYHEQGRLDEAETQWKRALADKPDFQQAYFFLADIYLQQGRTDNVRTIITVLSKMGMMNDAAVIQARLHAMHREYRTAQHMLESLIEREPKLLAAHVALSDVLLKEGKHRGKAEAVLRTILQIDPNNKDAQRNLDVLHGNFCTKPMR